MSAIRWKALLAAGLTAALLPAAWPQNIKGREADEAAIRQTVADYDQSFTGHDAHGTAMTFAEDGDFTNMLGVHKRGRKDIEERFTGLFSGTLKEAQRTDKVRSIRFMTPDVAVVDADTVITNTRGAGGSIIPLRKGLMTLVVTKQGERWLIAVFHEAEYPRAEEAPAGATK